MVKNFKQEDGTYLYPMELAGRKCEEDRAARAADIRLAKLEGYKVDWVQVGYRVFEAVLIPMSEERFKQLIQDEDRRQKAARIEGRCPIPNGRGGVIRCPERIPNPLYGQPGEPKTLKNDCVNCPYNTLDKPDYSTKSLSHSGIYNEDGEEMEMEIPCGFMPDADKYEYYCNEVLRFVEKNYPDYRDTMELLLQDFEKKEVAERLGVHRNTPTNQVNAMKDELRELIDNLFSMYD